ncbi:MAG TPA: hypothetical protein VIM17_13960, partial [Jatrophihabitantaceae bacterium]
PKAKRKRGGAKKSAETVEVEPEEHKEHRLAAIAAIHRAAHPDDEPIDAQAEVEATGVGSDTQDDLVAVVQAAEPPVDAAPAEPVEAAPAEPTESIPAEPVEAAPAAPRRRRAASRPAGPPVAVS